MVAFAAILIFTLVFWLFFIRTGINYAEHLVANVFFASYFQLFAAIISVILSLIHQASIFTELQLGFQLLYLPVAHYQFVNYHRPVKYLLTLLAVILAIGAWGLLSWQTIRLYIVHGL